VRFRILTVGETHQVDSYMAHDASFVKGCPNGLADLGQVDLWQTCLGGEAANVDELNATVFVVGPNQLDMTIGLNHK